MTPLRLESTGLAAARAALAPPVERRLASWRVLACATLMTATALALCAVVVLGGGSPQTDETPPSGLHGALAR